MYELLGTLRDMNFKRILYYCIPNYKIAIFSMLELDNRDFVVIFVKLDKFWIGKMSADFPISFPSGRIFAPELTNFQKKWGILWRHNGVTGAKNKFSHTKRHNLILKEQNLRSGTLLSFWFSRLSHTWHNIGE